MLIRQQKWVQPAQNEYKKYIFFLFPGLPYGEKNSN
jgi:hypothetical protein